jgi:hypothetical protein
MIGCIVSTFLILVENGIVMVVVRESQEKVAPKKMKATARYHIDYDMHI